MIIIPAFLRILRAYKWYGAIAGSILGLISFIRNVRKYPDRSSWWVALKSISDVYLMLAICIFCPPLLIALCVTWTLQFVKTPDTVWKTVVGVFAGISITVLAGWFLEIILVMGVFSMDLITGRIVRHWSQSRELPRTSHIFARANRA